MELDAQQRSRIVGETSLIIDSYFETLDKKKVFSTRPVEEIRNSLALWNFEKAQEPSLALQFVAKGLSESHLHTGHPRYFGVFNPRTTAMGLAGDMLTAAINPQLASHVSAPFAVEMEDHLIRKFGEKFGVKNAAGTFTSGGMEANHTAMLVALNKSFPNLMKTGVQSLKGQPTLYVSSEAHHSFLKAARVSGLGEGAIREVPVDKDLRMNPAPLREMIEEDLKNSFLPFMIVGTLGTTSSGVIDPLEEIAKVAKDFNLWFHVDGAWGGAVALVEELQKYVKGTEEADSLTLDAHKWFNVPMGAGLLICRHRIDLIKTFSTQTSYMPQNTPEDLTQPYSRSLQWSRRFIGLKIFLVLAQQGWRGLADSIRRQIHMGEVLRQKLKEGGWPIHNETPLPVICFSLPGASAEIFAKKIIETGKVWITTTKVHGQSVLRAGIPNYATQESDVEALVSVLEEVKSSL